MWRVKYLSFLVCLTSCFQPFRSDLKDRLFFKKIKTTSIEVEWYTYSAAWADSPDYITIKKGNVLDTVCMSDNIADIYVIDSNKVVIGFYGIPARYMEPVIVNEKVLGSTIIIDTAHVPLPPHPKQGFKDL